MLGFIAHNKVAALDIGLVLHNSLNISTNATRFSTRLGLDESPSKKGTQVNAFRHALWQSAITSKFGEDVARQVGYAHENQLPSDLSVRTFSGKDAMGQADTTADLLNNVVGRDIGTNNAGSGMQGLAIATLNYFHNKGLFTAQLNKDHSVTVMQTRITDGQYNNALKTLSGLNQNGFTAAEAQRLPHYH
jgi:hypothetical protein